MKIKNVDKKVFVCYSVSEARIEQASEIISWWRDSVYV